MKMTKFYKFPFKIFYPNSFWFVMNNSTITLSKSVLIWSAIKITFTNSRNMFLLRFWSIWAFSVYLIKTFTNSFSLCMFPIIQTSYFNAFIKVTNKSFLTFIFKYAFFSFCFLSKILMMKPTWHIFFKTWLITKNIRSYRTPFRKMISIKLTASIILASIIDLIKINAHCS